MSSESLFNAQLNQNGFNDNSILLNNNRRMQQQAQNLFRQRQMISQHQQLQQQQRPVNNVMTMNGLPPTPTLSSQGSPAFSQVVQAIPPAIKSTITPSTNKNLLTPQPMNNQPKAPTMGQAVLRLLQFRDQLSPGDQAQDISFWDSFVDDFFSPNATIKMGLWDNVQQKHAEFDIVQSLIARFFHTHYQCELESIQLTTDQTMEYFLPTGMMLECPRSSLIHRYKNGTLVILSGELSVLFTLDQADGNLKIQQWKFKCNSHDEYISRTKLIPANDTNSSKKKAKVAKPSFYTPNMLVNSWGLPERLYEILNVSDNSAQVGEVVFYSQVTGLSPQDALAAISFSLDQPLPFSYPPHTKEELEDIINSPLLSNDLLSMSNIPDTTTTTTNFNNNNNSSFINQPNTNTASSSAAPTPTPAHTNVIPNQQDIINYTQMNANAVLNNSPHFQNNISVNNVNFNMMNKPMQQQQLNNDMNTFQQPNHTMMGAPPQQNNGMSNIPQQQQQQQQSNNGMVNIPYQQQQQQMMQSMNTNPMNYHPMNGSPSQNNNNMAAPPPHMQMQQQAALQRYYQQQRMQQQQQALQMQQRQAMQRLQTPYTESPMSADSTPSTATPLTIENITPDPSKGPNPRKRKMSLQKDGPKKATKKGKKQQQQQQQQ